MNAVLIVLLLVAIVLLAPYGEKILAGLAARLNRRETYGNPPGLIRAIHPDELGYRGWADNPGDFEGSSAAALSAYVERSA